MVHFFPSYESVDVNVVANAYLKAILLLVLAIAKLSKQDFSLEKNQLDSN